MRIALPHRDPANPESACLDALISKLKARGEPDSKLIIEHLETAHAYLLGAMPEECIANCDLAKRSVEGLSGASIRREVCDAIDSVVSGIHRSKPDPHIKGHIQSFGSHAAPSTAPGLREFFHDTDTNLGVFYPVQHIIAVFASLDHALEGRGILLSAGLRGGDVIAVPGAAMARFLEDHRVHRGVWARVVSGVSRLLDTEVVLVDRYIEWAHAGSAFLIAYGRTESDLDQMSQLLKPLEPTTMHSFLKGYIGHLS